ncbi:ATP F0F1 synthase subunit I [Mesorhizobium sp. Root157]|uniref:AtpZ/AtpI family protein n=1 Tax=Mesorhizobium sp. Root157 TaxID=1736477 RepID=UPI0006FE47D3|nr:AtpZ/AtpI family protein [Mesorhizobium sp. Root157]KQZ93887.1 ATP F0F1 synthase subunit I [Mesorhizobium sp. Root157]
MANMKRPDGTGETGPGNDRKGDIRDDELEQRRRELEASLAARQPETLKGEDNAKAGGAIGYGQAFKLSSEFIAGVAVGVGIGWMIDRLAGTSPWGLIVFLLLGFAAGVLNVLRSAGLIAGFGEGKRGADPKHD